MYTNDIICVSIKLECAKAKVAILMGVFNSQRKTTNLKDGKAEDYRLNF